MIESPLLVRIVDLLILDHAMRHAFFSLSLLQAYVVPQLLKGPAWRPPHSVAVSAFLWAVLSVVDFALGLHPPAERRDLIVGLFVAATLVGGWACAALVGYLRRMAVAVREEQALAAHQ